MAKKTTKYTKSGIGELPKDKPVLYRIKTTSGKDNYVGIAKRGRVQERLNEHLSGTGRIPGAKVHIEQMASIKDARLKEARVISRSKPRYNKQGK